MVQPRGEQAVLETHRLTVAYGQRRVLDGVSLEVRRGEILAIVGGSGSGKSTLMRQLAMLHRPTSGTVHVFGTDVSGLAEDRAMNIRKRLGVAFQKIRPRAAGGAAGATGTADGASRLWPVLAVVGASLVAAVFAARKAPDCPIAPSAVEIDRTAASGTTTRRLTTSRKRMNAVYSGVRGPGNGPGNG